MKIQICDPLDVSAIAALSEFAEIIEKQDPLKSDAHVLVVRSHTQITKDVIDSSPNLKAIARAGVGLDNIDVGHAKSKGIQILNTPEAPSESVAELTITLILSLLRKVPRGDATTKRGQWLKKELKGSELHDKTLGLIGLGRIGYRVGELARAFGAKLIVFDPFVDAKHIQTLGAEQADLKTLLTRADIISIHAPLTDATTNLLDEAAFSHIKPGTLLVNTARGQIVNQDALASALKSGKLAGAALDVFVKEPPDLEPFAAVLEKLIFTPHIASSTAEAQARVGSLLVEKLKSFQQEAGI